MQNCGKCSFFGRFGCQAMSTTTANVAKPAVDGSNHKFKLTYFDGWSRGEVIRWCFALAGVQYEDNRVGFLKWPFIKSSMPFGQMPVLYVDDGKETISQQRAIARYIAKLYGFAGETALEQAKVDMYVDGVADLQSALDTPARTLLPWSKEKKRELYAKFREDSLKPFLDRYEGFLSSNKNGYFVGNKVSLADMFVAEILDRISILYDKEAVGGHKALGDHLQMMRALPSLADYLKQRPSAMA